MFTEMIAVIAIIVIMFTKMIMMFTEMIAIIDIIVMMFTKMITIITILVMMDELIYKKDVVVVHIDDDINISYQYADNNSYGFCDGQNIG